MRKLFFRYLWILTFFAVSGCNENTIDPVFYGDIEGTVVFEATGLPVVGAEISTAPASTIILTDSLGQFTLNDLPTNEYTITAKLDGYKSVTSKVAVTKNNTTSTDLRLIADTSSPNPPVAASPLNGAQNVARETTLKWSVVKNNNDKLTYEVLLFESNTDTAILNLKDHPDTLVNVKDLKFNTAYFWQVNVKNSSGIITNGNLWQFKTLPFPDNRFLFTSLRDGNYEVYSSNESNSDLLRLTFSPKDQVYPRYSNNRSLIAYTENTDLEYHIYTMNNDGSGAHQVTTLPVAGFHNNGKGFCWSPDNGKFLYSHYDKLYTIDRNGANLTLIATAPAGRNYRSCDWTDAGNKIVVETVGVLPYDNEIHLIDLIIPKDTIIVNNKPGTVQSPFFSIDGKNVLYTYDVSEFESAAGRQLDSRVFIYNIKTGVSTDASKGKASGTNDLNPRYSPDGAKIIFENRNNDGSGTPSIWIYDISQDKRSKLFDNGGSPDWQ